MNLSHIIVFAVVHTLLTLLVVAGALGGRAVLTRTEELAETALCVHIIHAWQATDPYRIQPLHDEITIVEALRYVRRIRELLQTGDFVWPPKPGESAANDAQSEQDNDQDEHDERTPAAEAA